VILLLLLLLLLLLAQLRGIVKTIHNYNAGVILLNCEKFRNSLCAWASL